MTDITIPPAALEAGARAIHHFWFDTWAIRWDDLEPFDKDQFRTETRAAFLAIVEAWPGRDIERFMPNSGPYTLLLPLPTKETDA